LTTKGLDFKASYRLPLPALGSLLFGFEGTKLQSLTTTPVIGGGSYDCTGFFGSICGAANPSWRHVLNATWSTPWDGLDLSVRWRYIGSDSSEQTSSNSFLTGSPFLPLSRIPTFSYIDLTGTFNLYKNVRLELGVNNIVDKNPPLVVGVTAPPAARPARTATATPSPESTTPWGDTCSPISRRSFKTGSVTWKRRAASPPFFGRAPNLASAQPAHAVCALRGRHHHERA